MGVPSRKYGLSGMIFFGGETIVTLDLAQVGAQTALLKQQSAAALHAAGLLRAYRAELLRAWEGPETEYFARAVEDRARACEELSRDADALCADIVRAAEDILREESGGTASLN